MNESQITDMMKAHADSVFASGASDKPRNRDNNDMSYWFPILSAVPGIRTPRTVMERRDGNWEALIGLLDGDLNPNPAETAEAIDSIRRLCDQIGYPCFLRSGQTSYKHGFTKSCYVPTADAVPSHVAEIVNFSECCDFFGLDYSIWAAREFLPLAHSFKAFYGMPVAREFRLFIRKGEVQCIHPYWPKNALVDHVPDAPDDWESWLAIMNNATDCEAELRRMATDVALRFPDYWSLDFAQHVNGDWYAIDMAVGEQSFHWPECEHCPEDQRAH